jgi:hypothetical protein
MIRLELRSVSLLLAVALAVPAATTARPDDDQPSPAARVDAFEGWFHSVGTLWLHVSNRGFFGGRGGDATNPSGEWPGGSNHEYLYGAGLWVGGVVAADTFVTAGLYQLGEFWNHEEGEGCGDPPVGICATSQGAPNGLRNFDDDGDSMIDEDRLDGRDNDGDALIDEDFAAISNEMFATEFYDSSTFFNQFFPDPVDHHHPLGLHVTQETYQWSHPMVDDFVGVEYRIKNASRDIDGVGWEIQNIYVGMMVDGDCGVDDNDLNYWMDDQAAYTEKDTAGVSVRMAYMYDENGGANAADDVPGYLGVMLLDHTVSADRSNGPQKVAVHAYRNWSGGDEDPRDDVDRYNFLKGQSDTGRTIDPPTTRPNDYRYLVSAGPFGSLAPDSSITVQFAFVGGLMIDAFDPQSGGTVRVPDLTNPIQAQTVYNGFSTQPFQVHWTASLPPPPPNSRLVAGNGAATIEWDDFPEFVPDPISGEMDFAGYRVERAGPGSQWPSDEAWSVIAEYGADDLASLDTGVTGVGKYRLEDSGLRNFQRYFYRVGSWDQTGLSGTSRGTELRPRAAVTVAPEPIRVQPNPARARAPGDPASSVRFLNLPEGSTVKIYSIDGRLVSKLEPGRETEAGWSSSTAGIYFYRIETPEGPAKNGKLVVLR